ncbi:MAG: hypothetical protein JWP08_3401, partial [Bryobacterales bacterium]|nr:hypothetical protein [Bryobacterales bacterium]
MPKGDCAGRGSDNKPVNYVSGDVRQTKITALESVYQLGVIDAHLVKNCG